MAYRHFFRRPAPEQRFEQVPAHAAMQFADTVDRTTAMDSEISHVKRLCRLMRVLPTQTDQVFDRNMELLRRIVGQISRNQNRIEVIESRRYGRMRSKEISYARNGQCFFEAAAGSYHIIACAFQYGKCSMSF